MDHVHTEWRLFWTSSQQPLNISGRARGIHAGNLFANTIPEIHTFFQKRTAEVNDAFGFMFVSHRLNELAQVTFARRPIHIENVCIVNRRTHALLHGNVHKAVHINLIPSIGPQEEVDAQEVKGARGSEVKFEGVVHARMVALRAKYG